MHDDLETKLGKIKIKNGGSHQGHNGIRSCIDVLGKDFKRIKVGIGRPETRNQEIISSIKKAYRIIYRSEYNFSQALQHIRDSLSINEEINKIIDFIKNSSRGII